MHAVRKEYEFPSYTRGEERVDLAVHTLGVLAALSGGVWLLSVRAGIMHAGEVLSLVVYATALGTMTLASTAYHFTRPGRVKEVLRRVDHAVIFALIAGTYTPFAVHHAAAGGTVGAGLWIVWAVALAGIVLKLRYPRRYERSGLILYVALSWAIVFLAQPMWAALETPTLILLGFGGLLYLAGTALHLMESLPYHNAAWHAFVLTAAGCHFAAVLIETGTRG